MLTRKLRLTRELRLRAPMFAFYGMGACIFFYYVVSFSLYNQVLGFCVLTLSSLEKLLKLSFFSKPVGN